MKESPNQSNNDFLYKGVAASLKQRYFEQFKQYHRKYLDQKMKCYERGTPGSPITGDIYYPCIQQVENQMKSNSKKLANDFDIVEQSDKQCQTICQKNVGSNNELDDCIKKCFSQYSDSANKIYSQYYNDILK